jgi:hypothetical protein
MQEEYINKQPVVLVKPYSTSILFNESNIICEHKLTGNDRLTPVTAGEDTYPIPSYKSTYRLIGNGVNSPVFVSPFKKMSTSANFDTTNNAVNIVEFIFDGAEYWYNIKSGAVVVPAPSGDTKVGTYGYVNWIAAPVLKVNVINEITVPLFADNDYPTGIALVFAFDVISSVHYTGTGTLTYWISDVAQMVPDSFSTDPKQAGIPFGIGEVGLLRPITVWVTDGLLTSDHMPAYVNIINFVGA